MKVKVTAVERHPFEQQEPKIERIKLRPIEPGPVQEIVLTGCDSSEFASIKEGQELELTVKPAADTAAKLPPELKPPSLAQKFKEFVS